MKSNYWKGSVMHYGAYGFAIDPTIPTIITPNGEEIGQRVGFSEVFHLIGLHRLSCMLDLKLNFVSLTG